MLATSVAQSHTSEVVCLVTGSSASCGLLLLLFWYLVLDQPTMSCISCASPLFKRLLVFYARVTRRPGTSWHGLERSVSCGDGLWCLSDLPSPLPLPVSKVVSTYYRYKYQPAHKQQHDHCCPLLKKIELFHKPYGTIITRTRKTIVVLL